jgi:bifunctional DNA-binding transcriptional regulator/antitoxin component of YhaV-PrlF toxin-antitoxin module
MNNNQYPEIMLPERACELCRFDGKDALALHAGEDTLVIFKDQMTTIELVHVISMLSDMATELTVALAKACGMCNNCSEDDDTGKKEPAQWVESCSLCRDLLDNSQSIHIPDYLREEAGITSGAKLKAYADRDSGKITVTEAENQFDISDVPPGILNVLAQSGVCLAELDELIMTEEIIYGK